MICNNDHFRFRYQNVQVTGQSLCLRVTCFDPRNSSTRQRNYVFVDEIMEKIISRVVTFTFCNVTNMRHKHQKLSCLGSSTTTFWYEIVNQPWIILDFVQVLHDHCIRRCNLQLYQRGETVNFFGIATRWYEELKGFFIIKKSTLRLRSFTFFISFIWLTHGPMAPWPTFGYIFGDMLTQLILIIPLSSSLTRGPPLTV